jgi:hypothetical protein
MNKDIDTRPRRTWFLKKEGISKYWTSASEMPPQRYESIQSEIKNENDNDYEIVTRIILSHTPLTFGHSQLIMKFLGDKRRLKESDRFEQVTEIIKNAILVFEQVLGEEKIHIKGTKFSHLSEITHTSGEYIKTLILRSSAEEHNDEEYAEYKVHLVPYFNSHAANCKSRYLTLHFLSTDKTGGLLGWLGERETEVDRWQNPPHPWANILNKIACEDWKMDEFARFLCEKWPSDV